MEGLFYWNHAIQSIDFNSDIFSEMAPGVYPVQIWAM